MSQHQYLKGLQNPGRVARSVRGGKRCWKRILKTTISSQTEKTFVGGGNIEHIYLAMPRGINPLKTRLPRGKRGKKEFRKKFPLLLMLLEIRIKKEGGKLLIVTPKKIRRKEGGDA